MLSTREIATYLSRRYQLNAAEAMQNAKTDLDINDGITAIDKNFNQSIDTLEAYYDMLEEGGEK